MKKTIDLANWNRREHFEFFRQFDEPFHGLVVNVECTHAYQACKQKNISFFLYYLHQVLQAVNLTDAMRLRIEDGQVVDHDAIHASATVGRDDHTFAFCRIKISRHSRRAQRKLWQLRAQAPAWDLRPAA
jgi:chloramphenicol O-acetyltransferase type A